jgi:glycerate 2-kinase
VSSSADAPAGRDDSARSNDSTHAVEQILRAAIASADPGALVERALTRHPLPSDARVHLIAVGKAAAPMADAAARLLGGRVADALVVIPWGYAAPAAPLRTLRAAHPLPDDASVDAGAAIVELLRRLDRDGVALFLISGGASALAVQPRGGTTLEQYRSHVQSALRAGTDIVQLNRLRRRIDELKGGGMAALAAPAHVRGLVLSDVIGDRLDIIASGPLTADANAASAVDVRVIGGNDVALEGAATCARELGFEPRLLAEPITGEARVAGQRLAQRALLVQEAMAADDPPVCLIGGGETTVTVRGDGRGGRNQELVLAAALALAGAAGITIGSAGTDGIDGPTPAAGAVADAALLEHARQRGLDPEAALERNDSYTFFDGAGGTIITGPTGTNVLDVQVVLIGRRPRRDSAVVPS